MSPQTACRVHCQLFFCPNWVKFIIGFLIVKNCSLSMAYFHFFIIEEQMFCNNIRIRMNEHYLYSYSVIFGRPNIIRIRIRSFSEGRILFVFVFGHFRKAEYYLYSYSIIFGRPNNIRIRIWSSKHYSLTSGANVHLLIFKRNWMVLSCNILSWVKFCALTLPPGHFAQGPGPDH